jgi:hypothetical protein
VSRRGWWWSRTAIWTGTHRSRRNSAYRSRPDKAIDSEDGPEFERIPLSPLNHFTPPGQDDDDYPADITAIAYDPSDPDNTWWLGTARGQIFRSDDGGARWTDPSIEDPAMRSSIISCIAVHPRHIVVCTIGHPFGVRVYITGDQGTNWRAVSAGLPSSPVTRVVVDPRGSDGIGAGNHQILYVGTVAGVYVAGNITPDVGGPVPVWQALNDGMPLVVVRDLALVTRQVVEPGGAVATRRFLRAATYGRGAYECEIDPGSTASVRLYIRSTPIEDGWRYHGGQRLRNDPRIVPTTDPLAQLRPHIAYDIRIDAQPLLFSNVNWTASSSTRTCARKSSSLASAISSTSRSIRRARTWSTASRSTSTSPRPCGTRAALGRRTSTGTSGPTSRRRRRQDAPGRRRLR